MALLRHAIEFAGRGALRHHHAASLLDGANAQGAVTAGAGENDADGVLALVFGQGMEKIVDGQPLPMRCTGFEQVKGALHEGHVVVGGDDVGAIDRDLHAVFHLKHLHAGVASNQVRENAFVVGSQMLHQDKCHARFAVEGHAGKKGLESGQTARRCADANDGEGRRKGDRGLGRVRRACGQIKGCRRGRFCAFCHGACLGLEPRRPPRATGRWTQFTPFIGHGGQRYRHCAHNPPKRA
jgi:hypothetical protein